MNDKDKEAFEKWWMEGFKGMSDMEVIKYMNVGKQTSLHGWQSACEYKDKSLINGTRMKQMNERIEELLIENANLIEKVKRTKLFLKERLSYADDDKDELFVNKYCLIAFLQELDKE